MDGPDAGGDMHEVSERESRTVTRVDRDVDQVLIDRHRIRERIDELAAEIRRDLDLLDDGDVVLVPILTGAVIFVADLMRRLPQKIRINVVTVSSYAGRTTESTGDPIIDVLPQDLHDKHVLIIDDILDSGTTIRRMREEIEALRPKSVRACVLLRKERESAMATQCEYVGFDIPDEFVVGFGLDYNDHYRNLPDICVLKKEAM
jgi:hypoxanthine phosphoribosyltransferase